jgi:hypothetical protein
MVPSADQVTAYFHSVESYVVETVTAASPDLPNVRDALNRLWDDVARFGPNALSDIKSKIPVLGDFELPPPPPPPAPEAWYERATDWASEHRWTVAGVGVGVVGAGLLTGYASAQAQRRARSARVKTTTSSERRQVVGEHSSYLMMGVHSLSLRSSAWW